MDARLITHFVDVDLVELQSTDYQVLEYLEEVSPPGEPRIEVSMTINRSAMEFIVEAHPPRRYRVNLRQLQDRSIEAIRADMRGDTERVEQGGLPCAWPAGWWILPGVLGWFLIWAWLLSGLL